MSKENDEFNISKVLVDRNVEQDRGSKVAYHFHNEKGSGQVTYLELLEMVNKTGSALHNLGVAFENRVMILEDDRIEAVASILGAIKIGAIPFAANTMMKSKDYGYLLNDSRANTAIVGQDYLEIIESEKDNLKYLRNLVVIGDSSSDWISYQELVNGAELDLQVFNMPPDEIVLWQYSSGTTGRPKGVMHTQQGIISTADTYFKQVLSLDEDDVCFSLSKLFFGYGQGNSVWGPLRAGASAVLLSERVSPEKILKIVEEDGVTILFAAPTHYNKILEDSELLQKYDLTSLRVCVSAGEPLPPVIYNKWKQMTRIDILDGIGSTEAFHIFISNRPSNVTPGSSGTPVPRYEVRIIDEQFNEVNTGDIGRLLVKGESLALGYWNKYSKTKETFIGEWLFTGDMYYRDNEGYYWYCGRSDDMIRSGGVWVSPIEVEKTLMEHPAILEAAAVQGYTAEGLQRVKAVVVLRSGYDPKNDVAEDVKGYVRKRMKSFEKPEWICFVKELPKTSTGKIQRYKFRETEDQLLINIRERQIQTRLA